MLLFLSCSKSYAQKESKKIFKTDTIAVFLLYSDVGTGKKEDGLTPNSVNWQNGFEVRNHYLNSFSKEYRVISVSYLDYKFKEFPKRIVVWKSIQNTNRD